MDECFLDLTGFRHLDLGDYGRQMRDTIYQWTGLPISVGIGASKTLAKLANHCAKSRPEFRDVCDLSSISSPYLDRLMAQIPNSKVWGIGQKLGQRLTDTHGLRNVLDVKRANPDVLRRQFNVIMEKTIRELNGIACIELEHSPAAKKQIISSRSFGRPVTDKQSLAEAITLYVSRAARKLRQQQSVCATIHVYIRTGVYRQGTEFYRGQITLPVPVADNDSRQLLKVALTALNKIYEPGYRYAKAGIVLSQISTQTEQQLGLFAEKPNRRHQQLMQTLDNINRQFGRDSLKLAREGFQRTWQMKQGQKSFGYTTNWQDNLIVAGW